MDCFERLEIKKEIVRKKKVLTWKLSMFPLSNWSLVIFLVNDLLLLLMLLSSFWLCSLFVLSLARVNLDTISFFSISSEVHFHFRSMGRIRQRKLPPLGGAGSITVQETSCLFCLDSAALFMLIKPQHHLFGRNQISQTGGPPYNDDGWLSCKFLRNTRG